MKPRTLAKKKIPGLGFEWIPGKNMPWVWEGCGLLLVLVGYLGWWGHCFKHNGRLWEPGRSQLASALEDLSPSHASPEVNPEGNPCVSCLTFCEKTLWRFGLLFVLAGETWQHTAREWNRDNISSCVEKAEGELQVGWGYKHRPHHRPAPTPTEFFAWVYLWW